MFRKPDTGASARPGNSSAADYDATTVCYSFCSTIEDFCREHRCHGCDLYPSVSEAEVRLKLYTQYFNSNIFSSEKFILKPSE